MSKGLQIAIGALAVAALLGWYGWHAIEDAGTYRYFQTLDEFRAAGAVAGPARVHGYVAEASIERDLEAQVVRFHVQSAPPHAGGPRGRTLEVLYSSLETPDLFKDGAEVVVEGQLVMDQGEVVFEADNLLAKCPSKFEAQAGPASEPSIEL